MDERRDFRTSETLSENKELLLRFKDIVLSPKAADRAMGRWRSRDGLGLRRPPVGEGDGKVTLEAFSIVNRD